MTETFATWLNKDTMDNPDTHEWQWGSGNVHEETWKLNTEGDGVQLREKAQVKWVNLMAGQEKLRKIWQKLKAKPGT